MELFQQMVSMGHERVVVCSNPEVGLRGIIAVHNTVLGPGLGGVRMWPYESFDEALWDVLRLSRGMTYKAAITGLKKKSFPVTSAPRGDGTRAYRLLPEDPEHGEKIS